MEASLRCSWTVADKTRPAATKAINRRLSTKLSIATGHAMQIYNCLNYPRQLYICIARPVAMLNFATAVMQRIFTP